jgi:hypothetical protein
LSKKTRQLWVEIRLLRRESSEEATEGATEKCSGESSREAGEESAGPGSARFPAVPGGARSGQLMSQLARGTWLMLPGFPHVSR